MKKKPPTLAKLSKNKLQHPLSKKSIYRTVLLLLCLQSIPKLQAQEIEPNAIFRFIPLSAAQQSADVHAKTKKMQADTIMLPFWEDFSNANFNTSQQERFVASPERWAEGSQTVRINTGLDINAPTVGVATFDGVDQNGNPYSNQATEEGLADSLISLPIDLSAVPTNARQTVFFSFFWQQFGRGEFPDPEDSIRLQFKNAQNEWLTQWSRSGGDTLFINEFKQEMIQIISPGFYHAGFQFRFQSFNRLSGAYDTWNIDYIYLNSKRSASNTAYLDRALTRLPSSPFGDYTAVPMNQFVANPDLYVGSSSVEFYNLNVQLQPVRFTALLRNQADGEVIQLLNDDNALSPIPSGLERRTITANPLDVNAINQNLDSIYIETEFHITSGDNYLIEQILPTDTIFQTNVDYRVNDTVRATFVLDEYFAYDDGEAEFGVEVNQNGGKIAYQFEAPQRDLLTHIDIYFPALAQNQGALPFQLLVWKSLEDSLGEEVVLRTQQSQTNTSDQINQFTTFELASPVFVEDTFYIGYEQQGDTFIAIGFDKTTNASAKTYYNVTGAWAQDSTLVGSLMMRPGFDKYRDVTAIDDEIAVTEDIQLFPNPTPGKFRINKPFDALYIYDISGKLLLELQAEDSTQEEIEAHLLKGVYIVRIFANDRQHTRKLIVR